MKTDFFTRIVLTVIALSLVWICIKPFAVQTARADRQETINVNIQKVGGHYVSKSLPVAIFP